MKEKYGKYKIISVLGSGANGVVYECTNDRGEKFAIKLLKKSKRDKKGIKRFKNEIKILNKEKNNTGILPIIDYSDDKEYWYVMPIATPISSVINTLNNEKIILHIYRLSKVLIDLHKNGVFHRDIKPENLFLYNENIVLSDFGMVHFPDGYFVTKENDKIFPNPIFAPEMNNITKITDYSKVDVYSLAKTFWCLLTQSKDAFAGVYSVNDELMNIEIKAMEKIENPGWLHTLFEKSTTTNPKERIDMQEFSKIIHKNCYLGTPKVYNNWTMNWKSICDRLICSSLPIPKCILWDKIEDIRLILNEVYKFKNTCNTIFSNGGDMPFEGDIEIEDGRLVFKVLDRNNFFYTIKPKCLLFIPINNNPCYNFFWLEANGDDVLYPKYKTNGIEELIDYNGKFYSLQYYLEHEDEFNYEKTKRIVRTIQGSWMIVNKNGFWNMDFKDAFSSELYNNYGWSDIRERLLKVEKQTPIPPHQNLIDGVV